MDSRKTTRIIDNGGTRSGADMRKYSIMDNTLGRRSGKERMRQQIGIKSKP
jgi:hypothetical protein